MFSETRKPVFLGIGAQRAATTWLYECLRRHPELFLSETKEIHFFDKNYEKGWDWYESHFADCPSDAIAGEITPNYLNIAPAAGRIAQDLPNVKLIAILREPVSRARSSYELLKHRFPGQTFEQACSGGGYLVELGLYAKHLKRFYELFDRSQILVLLYEDVSQDPDESLKRVCEFIGVTPMQLTEGVAKTTNSVVLPRTQEMLRRVGLGGALEFLKQGKQGDLIRSSALMLKRLERRKSKSNHLKKLFVDDVRELEQLISRDLSHWR